MIRPVHEKRASGFTLIELMVVVAIIGLLVGVLLPAFSAIRTSARNTQTSAQLNAIDSGLNLFRGDFGSSLPPSSSDNRSDRQLIANPKRNAQAPLNNNGAQDVRVSGAQLLVHALIGADGLGTPGFKDFGNGGRNGRWWDDTHDDDTSPYGAYAINPADGKERHPRSPGPAGYVDDKTKARAKTIAQLVDQGVVVNFDPTTPPDEIAVDEATFVDAWDHPILYYKASKGSRRMVADAGNNTSGIYRQEDNGIFTGSANGALALPGLDYGPGKFDPTKQYFHPIADAVAPLATDLLDDILTDDSTYEHSFARFILDPAIKARPTPVRTDSYLLISAGPDGFYGNNDDVVNWTKEVQ